MRLEIGRSYWLLTYLIAVHLFLCLVLISVPIQPMFKLGLVVLLLTSLIIYCHRHQWLGTQKPMLLSYQNEQWCLRDGHGYQHQALTLYGSYVSSQLVIMNFKHANSYWSRHIVITADAVASQDLHKLRLFLRDPATWAK